MSTIVNANKQAAQVLQVAVARSLTISMFDQNLDAYVSIDEQIPDRICSLRVESSTVEGQSAFQRWTQRSVDNKSMEMN